MLRSVVFTLCLHNPALNSVNVLFANSPAVTWKQGDSNEIYIFVFKKKELNKLVLANLTNIH